MFNSSECGAGTAGRESDLGSSLTKGHQFGAGLSFKGSGLWDFDMHHDNNTHSPPTPISNSTATTCTIEIRMALADVETSSYYEFYQTCSL